MSSQEPTLEFELGNRTFRVDTSHVRCLVLQASVLVRAWEAEVGSKQDLADDECAAFLSSLLGGDIVLIDAAIQEIRETVEGCEVEPDPHSDFSLAWRDALRTIAATGAPGVAATLEPGRVVFSEDDRVTVVIEAKSSFMVGQIQQTERLERFSRALSAHLGRPVEVRLMVEN